MEETDGVFMPKIKEVKTVSPRSVDFPEETWNAKAAYQFKAL